MSKSEKAEVIMKALGFTRAELKAMTTPDDGDKRLNRLYEMAKDKVDKAVDTEWRQTQTLSLS
ncbi:hypothetical protein [Lactiplantibacillus plantarum]|uniref:Uncharacterized protein n=1 Tax=Lactiplantibacillus plantarum WJL TaxID=1350466 RepID=A0A837P5K3_LACPN|nr:hypothetical protein [Lactiplantibacillus plantarum]ASL37135.1 hypothetical protein CBI37_06615 [Lactiplantibacillus plantarum]ASZ31945.1 hypothetical protein CLC99_01005 [Lactiplantibacillus plantarum]ERO41215.1 hypothetical protein LPLWJ_16340 [Lactiplantibacillus plantarum WJL]KPN44253.1 hypothetical protein WJL_1330 [Lactiplantibacillus plantarum WJL]WGJ12098.1 hypothetical protein QEO67_04440 [Lactiplantibacillus plantarum]